MNDKTLEMIAALARQLVRDDGATWADAVRSLSQEYRAACQLNPSQLGDDYLISVYSDGGD
jgi:hypothetical protein